MNKHLIRIFSALLVVSVLLTACSGTTVNTTTEKPPLLIGWSLYPGWYPLVLAQELGLYEKHNVDVKLVQYDAYKNTAPQLASGLVDGAALVLGDVLLEDVGNSSTVVLITDNSNGADQLIASPEVMESKDLKGKRIGFSNGTFGELLVREMLDDLGVNVKDVLFVEVPPEAVADAIPGAIDIGHTFEPFASQARAKGNGVLYTSADAPGVIVDTIAFNNQTLATRPEDVRNFINAWFEAVEYWKANPANGNALIAKATGQNVADINFEGIKFFDRQANLDAFQPGSDTKSVFFTANFELEFLISTGAITKPLDINDILNPSYLQ